jgi:serine/threonine protein kinase
MTTTPACPRCGAPLAARTTPGGMCARCLLAAAKDEPASEPGPVAEAPRPPTPAELAPHFPGLAIEALIGRGGMGAVYRARQTALERTVALKVLHAHVAERPGFSERFGREARTLARLDHENLVTVHEFGHTGPWFYFVMEHVDGPGLRQMLEARSVSPREALGLVAQICDALQYAHDQGVVHRDIKPENILVDRRGRVRILDFGLSKLVGLEGRGLTHSHLVMGTPQYMAPEQWTKPLSVDHRADIYSLGVVFYELLTGELPVGPYQAPSKRVALDVRLDEVVLRTLEREPEQRFQNASEVKTRVEAIGRSPAPVRAREVGPRKRHGDAPLYWVLGAILAFALAMAVFFALFRLGL